MTGAAQQPISSAEVAFGDDFDHILAAAKTGAPWAWERIYTGLSPLVLGYLRVRGAPEPEDTLGQVFLEVVKGIERFTGSERDFRAWILTIAHGRLVDAHRRRGRGPELVPRGEEVAELMPAGDTEQEALDRLGTQWVRSIIASLSSDQADVLLLRILGQLTIEETANALGKRPGAVKALQRRGLAAIRRKISQKAVPL